MKDANRSTQLKTGNKQAKGAPAPAEPGKEHRAEPGSERHHENQKELGVTEDHRTEDMKQDNRGTFP
jgi:hypothetical protein